MRAIANLPPPNTAARVLNARDYVTTSSSTSILAWRRLRFEWFGSPSTPVSGKPTAAPRSAAA